MSRVLAVDPGDVRIGLAISDPTRTLSRPHSVLKHISRKNNARRILAIAREVGATLIVVGVPYGLDGETGPQARKALRLVKVLQEQHELPIETWDESGSTQFAAKHGTSQAIDARAAAVILQEYLNAIQD